MIENIVKLNTVRTIMQNKLKYRKDLKRPLTSGEVDANFEFLAQAVSGAQFGIKDMVLPNAPAPSESGQYPVKQAGVYSGFKDSNGQAISVTADDFKTGIVYIIYNGDYSYKFIAPIPLDGEVAEGDMRGVSGSEVYQYAPSIKDLGQVMSISRQFDLEFVRGYLKLPGNWISGTNNWLSAKVKNASINTTYTISGYMVNGDQNLNNIRVGFKVGNLWYTEKSELNSESITVTTPDVFSEMIITVAAEKDVALDIEKSKYLESLKIVDIGSTKESYLKGEAIKGNIKTEQIESIEKYISNTDELYTLGTGSVKVEFIRGNLVRPKGFSGSSNNWLTAVVTDSIPETKYIISGFPSEPLSGSGIHEIRVGFRVNDGTWETISSNVGATSIEVRTPKVYDDFYVTIAAEKDVAVDPKNNKYKHTFKVQEPGYVESHLHADKIKGVIDTEQIRDIEKAVYSGNTGDKHYMFGSGAPILAVGKKGDLYLDVLTNIKYKKGDVFWSTDIFSYEIPIKTNIQNIFTDTKMSVYRLKNRLKYIPKYKDKFLTDITTIVEPYLKNIVYVDINKGDDTNIGSITKPFKTIKGAVLKGNFNLYIKKGFYHRDDVDLGNYNVLTESFTMICEDEVYLTSSDAAHTYTWVDEGELKRTTRKGVGSIIDVSSEFDKKKGFFNLKECVTKSECQNSLNSFYKEGEEVYINTDIDLKFLKLVLEVKQLTFFLGATCKMFYMENANIYIQDTSSALFVGSSTSKQSNATVCIKNVNTYLNTLGNGIAIDNLIDVFTQNCGGYGMKRDALNYHTSRLASGFKKMQVIEFNGWSYDTGLDSPGEGSSNGSTAHEGMSIYRFGGNFELSRGSTVVDVNDGIKSINCDVTAIGSYLGTTASFQVQDGTMWLYNCVGFDSTNVCKADGNLNNPTIHYDPECYLDGKKIGNIVFVA